MSTITIYSKDKCGYCDKAIKLCRDNEIGFTLYKLDPQDPDYPGIITFLKNNSDGHSTFPWIFVGGDFIGGFDKFKIKFYSLELLKYGFGPTF